MTTFRIFFTGAIQILLNTVGIFFDFAALRQAALFNIAKNVKLKREKETSKLETNPCNYPDFFVYVFVS